MKLYYSPGACSLSPHIVLREAGAAFELVRVDLRTRKTEHDLDYAAINPKGYVPALVLDNGQTLTEGPAIVQYIADQYPQAALAPVAGTFDRARLQEWLNFIATELHKPLGSLFRPVAEVCSEAARQNIARRLSLIDAHLAGHRYLLGEHYSVADAYLFTVLGWPAMVGIDLAPWPQLQPYRARIADRPRVQEALRAEGLV